MEEYLESIEVSLENFRKCGWQAAIREDYFSMDSALSQLAKEAIKEKRFPEGKVLKLLANAFSMAFDLESHNRPFVPYIVIFNEGRSTDLGDFQKKDIEFFAEIVDEIDDPKLCSRIADIVWLLQKPRNPAFAVMAIDNYCKIPLKNIGDHQFWERAIQLCTMLKKGAGERLLNIEKALVKTIKNATSKNSILTHDLSNVLLNYGLGRDDNAVISEKLESFAIEFEKTDEYLGRSRVFFSAALDYHNKYNNHQKATEILIKMAEGWVKEAVDVQSTGKFGCNTIAKGCYENAIQTYRKIPNKLRGKYGIDKRIHTLRTELNLAGEKSLDERVSVPTEATDISDLIEMAIHSVENLPLLDTLLALTNIHPGATFQKNRKAAENIFQKYHLQFLYPMAHISREGKVSAIRPGTLGNESNETVKETIIWEQTIQSFSIEVSFIVYSLILPALQIIKQEHRIIQADFSVITHQSPIIPQGREKLFARGLYLGYDNDFVTALHVLIPQIEHLVRTHLKEENVQTTTLDSRRIETENGLSTLMEHPEVNTIFGKDLAFELKALFCDASGPNLRNKLAHGLLDYDESQSTYSIYAWWLTLRIVFNSVFRPANSC